MSSISQNLLMRTKDLPGLAFRLSMLFLITAVVATAQGPGSDTTDLPETNDSLDEWRYDDYSIDSLDPEDFDFDSEEFVRTSTGWFPKPAPGATIGIDLPILVGIFDRADGIRSTALVATTEPFSDDDPYDCGFFEYLLDDLGVGEFIGGCSERRILRPGSDEPTEDGYPVRSYSNIGLRFQYNLPFPLIIRAAAGYRRAEGLLFSEDTTRSYLGYDGRLRPFREIGVLAYDRQSIAGEIGLQIPIYGAFIESDIVNVGSYYYIYGGYGAEYALANRAVQYTQIADVKDQIRYGNDQDTTTLLRRNNPEGFDRVRTSIEVAVGWNLLFEVATIGFELTASIPTRSNLKDAEWKSYYGGARLTFGYLWGTGASWR